MAFTNYIQQITDTGGTTHDLLDSSASHFIRGTQTASTNVWTGPLPDGVTDYYDGLMIDYWLPFAGTSTAATLNLGGKGAKPVYRGNAATSGVTTHIAAKTVAHLTYIIDSGINSGNGAWIMSSYYDSDSNTVDRLRDSYFRPYAGEAVYRYKFVMQGADNRMYPIVLTNQENATQVAKVPTQVGLRPGRIWFYNTTTTVTAGGLFAANTLDEAYQTTAGAYNFNTSAAAYRMIYLRGTYNKTTDLFTLYKDNSSPCTSYYTYVPTNTANITLSSYFTSGYYYMLLGGTYSSADYVSLFPYNPLYYFDGTNLIPVSTKVAQDTVPSTYVSTITTTAGAHTAISNKSGAVSFNVPTTAAHVGAVPTSRTVNSKSLSANITLTGGDIETSIVPGEGEEPITLTVNSMFQNLYERIPTVPTNIVNTITTTAGAHTAITNQTGDVTFNIPTTAAHVGAAASSHAHGNITNGGDITATAPTIANGDQLVINDHSASKITNGPTFDGSTVTAFLSKSGEWISPEIPTLKNVFGKIKVGSTTIEADTTQDTFELVAGTNITLTPDATNDKITISASGGGGGLSFDDIYPVGSIYISVNSTNPNTLFGGTWESIGGRFLVGAGSNGASGYEAWNPTAGSTGGEKDHLLAANESGVGAHSHGPDSGTYFATGSGTFSKASNRAQTVSSGGITNLIRTTDSGTISSPTKTKDVELAAGNAHNNLPPYLVVYIWKRTA